MSETLKKAKEAPPNAPDISILGDQVTLFPSGYTASPNAHHDTHDSNLVAHMARLRERPLDFLREISLHVSGTGWRGYDKVLGQPIFYNGFTENMKNAVMATPMLKAKIEDLAQKRLDIEDQQGLFKTKGREDEQKKLARRDEIVKAIKEVTWQLTDDMLCKMESRPFIRFAYYLVTQLLTRAYHQGIHVSSEEVLRLRSVAEKAAKDKVSIIFLPCHRSHIDYVSLQLICFRLGIGLPTVVAGDNLNFPLVGPFLQHAGAMWIRRSFGDDQLYTTLVQSYIDTLLQRGFNFECFIEGGRSRMGKLLPPKFGILSFILDSIMSGRVKDAIICPVSTQYDKVIEVDSYISELLGTPKQKENLADFFSASSILSLKLGRIDCRFHEPWSLKDFIDSQQQRFDRLPMAQQEHLQSSYKNNLRIRLLRTMGYKVLSDINAVSVVMPTSLIGTVLLTLRGRGVGKSELIRRVEWLSERVRDQGGRVAHFAGTPTSVVVERTLEVLGPNLIGIQKTDVAEETYHAVDRFQLSFYRNMLIHLFVSRAIVSASMYTKIKAGGPPEQQSMSYDELLSSVSFLSRLFRGEFIFTTQGIEANLDNTLEGLERDGVFTVTRKGDNMDRVEISNAERVTGRENYDFYCFLIWPFIETFWLGAVSLMMIVPQPDVTTTPGEPVWLNMKVVQTQAQLLGKTLYAQGDLSYFESVNKETLKNAFAQMEEEGIIIVQKPRKDQKGQPEKVRLAEEWMPARGPDGNVKPEGRLWEFCDEISKSRLEGKNRRDGDTVTGRLLRLVESVGKEVWTNLPVEGGPGMLDPKSEKRKKKKNRSSSQRPDARL